MILPRFLTALLGVPLLILSIHFGGISFFILFFGIILLALHEFFSLAKEAEWPVQSRLGLILGAALSLSIFLFGTQMGFGKSARPEIFFTPLALTVVLIALVFAALFSSKDQSFLGAGVTFLGIFYVVWSLSHLYLIRDLRPEGRGCTFFLFFVIWALDAGAWAGGKKFGKTPLSQVSPKKTWEGVFSGTIAAIFTGAVAKIFFLPSMTQAQGLLLAFAIAILAQLSDLSESLFKRNVGVKDSGSLLPGHGGLLDRFDSFLLSAPLYYYALVFLTRS